MAGGSLADLNPSAAGGEGGMEGDLEVMRRTGALENARPDSPAGRPTARERIQSGGSTEPRVIDSLREAKALALSLVAVVGEQIVGHIAFSKAGPNVLRDWFALGPLRGALVSAALKERPANARVVRERMATWSAG